MSNARECGREWVSHVVEPELVREERNGLEHSVGNLWKVIASLA